MFPTTTNTENFFSSPRVAVCVRLVVCGRRAPVPAAGDDVQDCEGVVALHMPRHARVGSGIQSGGVSSHLHVLPSSRPPIFTSSHPPILHPPILTSSRPHVFPSSAVCLGAAAGRDGGRDGGRDADRDADRDGACGPCAGGRGVRARKRTRCSLKQAPPAQPRPLFPNATSDHHHHHLSYPSSHRHHQPPPSYQAQLHRILVSGSFCHLPRSRPLATPPNVQHTAPDSSFTLLRRCTPDLHRLAPCLRPPTHRCTVHPATRPRSGEPPPTRPGRDEKKNALPPARFLLSRTRPPRRHVRLAPLPHPAARLWL